MDNPVSVYYFCDFKARNYYPAFCYFIASSAVIFLSGILDWVVWGSFFHSYIENVYVNLIKGIGMKWGTMPFGWYLDILRNNMGWLLLLSIIVSVLAFYKSKLLSLSLLSVFFLHSLIQHKEYRFIFIVISFLSITSAVGIDILISKISKQYLRNLIASLIVISFLYTSFRLAPKYTIEKMGYFCNASLGRKSAWTAFQDNFLVYRFLSSLPDIWGLQDTVSDWYFSAGYYYLHKDIPIYTVDRLTQEEIFNNKFANYIITRELIARNDLELIKTINGIYVYRKNFLKKREIDPKYNTNR